MATDIGSRLWVLAEELRVLAEELTPSGRFATPSGLMPLSLVRARKPVPARPEGQVPSECASLDEALGCVRCQLAARGRGGH